MAISPNVHHNAKDFLNWITMVLVSTGIVVIGENVWLGVALLFLGVVVVFLRGIYKKFLNGGEKKVEAILA